MTLLGSTHATWFGSLNADLAHQLTDRATHVLALITDPAVAHEHARRAEAQSRHGHGWVPTSLAQGDAGLALAHAILAATSPARDVRETSTARAIGFLREAVASTREHPIQEAGLCNGTTGLLLAIDAVADVEPRFLPARKQLLAQHLAHILATAPLANQTSYTDVDFDLMSGRAGTLAYLSTSGHADEGVDALVAAQSRLVTDLAWVGTRDSAAPHLWRWMTNRLEAPSLSLRDASFPDNFLNAGLSHGLAGVTATLALAVLRGQGEFGAPVHEVLAAHIAWFMGTVTQDGLGPLWPAGCAVGPTGDETPQGDPSPMVAWCYGSAGIGLALLNAGRALGDEEAVDLGIAALRGTILRDAVRGRPGAATLCHGTAGVALLAATLAAIPGQQDMASHVDRLARDLLAAGDPGVPLLYRDLEFGTHPIDQPGFLNGAAGVALVLASLTATRRPRWVDTWLLQGSSDMTLKEIL